MRGKITRFAAYALAVGAIIGAPAAYAATDTATSELSQEVIPGTLSTDILDGSGDPVASPSFAMTQTTASTSVETTTGTFGSGTQRISVSNPGVSSDGAWSLALSATGSWADGGETYPYNGATAADGQLTVNPAVGAITETFGSGGATGVSLGTSDTFDTGTSSITLMTADNTADLVWEGYLTGVGLSQTVPAGTPSGNYTLTVTQTLTAV